MNRIFPCLKFEVLGFHLDYHAVFYQTATWGATFLRKNTFVISAATEAASMNGIIMIQSITPNGTVLKKGLINGMYIVIRTRSPEPLTAISIQRLLKAPIEKIL